MLLANVGSTLMHMGFAHLVFLNLLIGVVEGTLLSRWGKGDEKRPLAWMILANYISAWAGATLLVLMQVRGIHHLDFFEGPPLLGAGRQLLIMALGSFALTVVIELPFVLYVLRRSPRPWRERLFAAIWVQVASYAGLAVLYLMVSPMSLFTHYTRVKDISTLAPQLPAWVYYIDQRDQAVWRCRLDGSEPRMQAPLPEGMGNGFAISDGLWFKIADDESVELMLTHDRRTATLISGLTGRIGERHDGRDSRGPETGRPVDFRPVQERRDFHFASPYFDGKLSRVEYLPEPHSEYTRTISQLDFATPLLKWIPKQPTELPGGVVVFEFGHQIVIMDRRNRIGAIAIGRSPVVIMESEPAVP